MLPEGGSTEAPHSPHLTTHSCKTGLHTFSKWLRSLLTSDSQVVLPSQRLIDFPKTSCTMLTDFCLSPLRRDPNEVTDNACPGASRASRHGQSRAVRSGLCLGRVPLTLAGYPFSRHATYTSAVCPSVSRAAQLRSPSPPTTSPEATDWGCSDHEMPPSRLRQLRRLRHVPRGFALARPHSAAVSVRPLSKLGFRHALCRSSNTLSACGSARAHRAGRASTTHSDVLRSAPC